MQYDLFDSTEQSVEQPVFKVLEDCLMYDLKIKPSNVQRVKINSSETSEKFFRETFNEIDPDAIGLFECFMVAFLNNSNNTVGWVWLSKGSASATIVCVKSIVARALNIPTCSGVLLCHNHPSGNMVPSAADIDITKKIKIALNYFDYKLVDHIILSGNDKNYFSFADGGLL